MAAISSNESTCSSQASGTNVVLFPWRVQEMLSDSYSQGWSDVVSWLPDGKAFKVHNVPRFVAEILPIYFKQSKYKSFQRQLNLWGFDRVTTTGAEKGAYRHPHFLRDDPSLCDRLTRQKAVRKSSTSKRHRSSAAGKEPHATSTAWPHETPHVVVKLTPAPVTPAEVVAVSGEVDVVPYDDESLPSIAATPVSEEDRDADIIVPVDFEGCKFFPLEWECYQEMNRRVEGMMQRGGGGRAKKVASLVPTSKIFPALSTHKSIVELH